MVNLKQTVVYLYIQQIQSYIIIHLESRFWPPGEYKSPGGEKIFTLF